MMKPILLVLYLLLIFDITTSVNYKCNPRSPCGCSNRSTVVLTKIVGGEANNISNSWGWMGSLRRDNVHSCGVSLISPWFAITAAHCLIEIDSLDSITVNFGITNPVTIGQFRHVAEVFRHPSYNMTLKTNDLAILRLNKPISFIGSGVSMICLPKTSESDSTTAVYPPIGVDLVAIGWGLTDSSDELFSPVLRQVTIRSVDAAEPFCQSQIYDAAVEFCAGYPDGKKDTCRGDSGGPLMLFKNGRWELVGITSYGGACGSPGFASVYTRVAHYESFIQQIISSKNTFIPFLKNIDAGTSLRSNVETFFRKSPVELVFFFFFIIYKKFFFWN